MIKKKNPTNISFFLQKTKLFFQKNWAYIIVCLTAIIFLFFQKNSEPLLEQLRSIRLSYDKQIKKINDLREKERKANVAAALLLKKRLAEVKKQYDDAKISLEKKKKVEIENIMKQYGDDPTALAEKLSEITGFKIILPE